MPALTSAAKTRGGAMRQDPLIEGRAGRRLVISLKEAQQVEAAHGGGRTGAAAAGTWLYLIERIALVHALIDAPIDAGCFEALRIGGPGKEAVAEQIEARVFERLAEHRTAGKAVRIDRIATTSRSK